MCFQMLAWLSFPQSARQRNVPLLMICSVVLCQRLSVRSCGSCPRPDLRTFSRASLECASCRYSLFGNAQSSLVNASCRTSRSFHRYLPHLFFVGVLRVGFDGTPPSSFWSHLTSLSLSGPEVFRRACRCYSRTLDRMNNKVRCTPAQLAASPQSDTIAS